VAILLIGIVLFGFDWFYEEFLIVKNKIASVWKSILFVAAQFLTLGYLFISGPFADPFLLRALQLAGFLLGLWAVLVMRIGHFNIAPAPLAWSKLADHGPYQFIRHPMYLALLLVTLPLILDSYSLTRGSVWLVLVMTLLFKMEYEEKLLISSLPGYSAYTGRTSKLIPGIF